MLAISKQEAMKALASAQSARAALSRAKEKANEVVEGVVGGIEITSAAFALGVINARFGGVEFVGVPLDLWISGAMHGLGFAGVGGPHAHALGNGAAAAYAHTLGLGIGSRMRTRAGAPSQMAASAGYRGSMSDADLANLVQQS